MADWQAFQLLLVRYAVSMATMGTRATPGMRLGMVQRVCSSFLTLLLPGFACQLVEAGLHCLAEAAALLERRLCLRQTCISIPCLS